MTGLLQVKLKNTTATYMMETPTTPVNTKVDSSKSVSEKNGSFSNNNVLLSSLGGLAVVGFGYLAYRKFSGKILPKNETSTSGHTLLDIVDIKEKIKKDIIEKRQNLLAEINAKRSPYDSSPVYESGRDIIKRLNEAQHVHQQNVEELLPTKNKSMATIKSKLKNLAGDKDWQFLRNSRKNLIKIINGSYPKRAQEIAYNKVLLINDLLINKVYPDEQKVFLNFHGFSHEDGLNLIKTKFSNMEDYNKACKELREKNNVGKIILTARERNFKHYMPLTLSSVFPDEANVYKTCRRKLFLSSGRLNVLKKAYSDYIDGLKQIAIECRHSENNNSLKNAVASLQK